MAEFFVISGNARAGRGPGKYQLVDSAQEEPCDKICGGTIEKEVHCALIFTTISSVRETRSILKHV